MNRQEKIQVEKEKKAISKRTVDVYLLATVVGLHKEFGFGAKRIEKALAAITKEAEVMSSGMIGLSDYEKYAEELTGFRMGE